MKKIIITIAAALLMGICSLNAQSVNVNKEGKTFTATKVAKTSSRGSGYQPTGFTYIDVDGEAYEIYTHEVTKGKNAGVTKCYIQRASKNTGKPYWKEIPIKSEELR